MAQNYSTRKRGRSSCEDECCGFMPLSKRINNLHIDGNLYNNCNAVPDQNFPKQEEEVDEWDSTQNEKQPQAQFVNSSSSSEINTNTTITGNFIDENCTTPSPANGHPWMRETIINQYSPSLTATDNPYYYENNKLLFALYMERLQRGGVPLY